MQAEYPAKEDAHPCRTCEAGRPNPISGRLFLCAGCRRQVMVCSCCDRGQIYCAGGSVEHARRRTVQQAGRRYQASHRGRRMHVAQIGRWRARREKVTHHGSPAPPAGDLSAPAPSRPPWITTGRGQRAMVTPPDIEAQILRYYHAERWTTGTLAQQLHVHHSVVRRVFWHPAFRKPSEGGLFVFLVSEARWQDGWERTARGSVALKRGQVLICEAELAELWDFHRNKLRRVLRSMADHRIITMGPLRHGDIQGTLITILNYDK